MTVRFKSEYQRSYRSRSVSPQHCAPFAGLRSDHMGISREPCLQRRRKCTSYGPPRSCGSPQQTPAEPVPDAHTSKTPAAPKKQSFQPAEPEPPPAPRPAGEPSGKPIDTEKSATCGPSSVKSPPPKPESQRSSSPSPAPDQQQQSVNNHALRRKAGLRSTGPRSGLHKTEYNTKFNLKKAPAAPSPILTAYQALYSSHSAVPPHKKNPVSMDTEYQRSFQGLVLPTSSCLQKNLEHERIPLFHTHVNKKRDLPKNKPPSKSEPPRLEKKVNRSQTSNKELPPGSAPSNFPVQRRYRLLTEYEARFCSPLNKILEEGEAMGSHTPQIKELREQALLYRHRAWGTNFSRDHLSQLLSEHNALWEPTETIDSETDRPHSTHLDLCQVSSAGPDSCSSSCLEALDLASHSSRSSRRTSAVGSKDGEVNQTNNNAKTKVLTLQSTENLPAESNLVSAKENEKSDDEEEGRLPTPKLKMLPVQRTHHDLTTPATVFCPPGGAILVGKLQGTDEPTPQNQATFAIQRSGNADSVLAKAETSEQVPVKPREAWSKDSAHHNGIKSGTSPLSKPVTYKQTPPVTAALPPTVPLHCIQGTLRHADFQHNGELGLRVKERPCTTGCCGSDEDDRLSVMSSRSAASCSMASAILERAQKRRENFWGKR